MAKKASKKFREAVYTCIQTWKNTIVVLIIY